MPGIQSRVEITLEPSPSPDVEEDLKRDLDGILRNAIESNAHESKRGGKPLRFVLEHDDAASISAYLSVRNISFKFVVK